MTSSGVIIIDGDAKHLNTPGCEKLAAVIPDAPEQVALVLPQNDWLTTGHCGTFACKGSIVDSADSSAKKEKPGLGTDIKSAHVQTLSQTFRTFPWWKA